MARLPAAVAMTLLVLVAEISGQQQQEQLQAEGRNFSLPFLQSLATNVAVSSQDLGNKAGVLLASTFFTAAVWTNLPQEVKDNFFGLFSSSGGQQVSRLDADAAATALIEEDVVARTTTRRPSQQQHHACDCESYCYETYFRDFYSSNVNGFDGDESESSGRRRR